MLRQKKLLLLIVLVSFAIGQNMHAQTADQNSGGLGVRFQIDQNSRFPVIIEVIKGMPAEQMHLQPNDFITKINNQSTNDLAVDEVNNKIRGSIGSLCYITIWRNGVEYPVSFTRARMNAVWEPGKVDEYYHIIAAERENMWNTEPGYEFLNPGRLGDLRTVWKPGLIHPGYKIVSCNKEGLWSSLPGYLFVNPGIAGDFRTSWKPGLFHSDYHVISSNNEGYWVAAPGYRFISDHGLDVVWSPGIKYEKSKIISGQKEGTWLAYPGYVFRTPQINLDVVWKAGITNPNNTTLMSGTTEGSWVTIYQPSEINAGVTAVVELGIAALIEYYFGDNMLSSYLFKDALSNGIKSLHNKIVY